MRVLQVIHDFLPLHAAGSELYCYYLSKELQKNHEVVLFFTETDPGRRQYSMRRGEYDGLPFYEAVHNHRYGRFEETYDNRQMERLFESVLDDVEPEVVHFQHLLFHSLGYPGIAKRRGIATVYTLHDYWLSCPNGGQRIRPNFEVCESIELRNCASCLERQQGNSFSSRVLQRLTRRHRRLAEDRRHQAEVRGDRVLEVAGDVDLFISPSPFLAERMVELGLPTDRLIVSDNGIRADHLAAVERRPSPTLRFGYVGTLVPHKGVHVLVEAFEKVLAARPEADVELRVHGHRDWFPAYTGQLVCAARDERIRFLGAFDNDRAGCVFAEIDVLVVPSVWWENSPVTIHEAILTATPVVASDFGGMADFVKEGENGLLFEVGDVDDLARRLVELVDDPGRVDALRRPVVPVKSLEEDAADMERRYRELAGRVCAGGSQASRPS